MLKKSNRNGCKTWKFGFSLIENPLPTPHLFYPNSLFHFGDHQAIIQNHINDTKNMNRLTYTD